MVEGILVNRYLEGMKRDYAVFGRFGIKLEPWPWPYSFAAAVSFDCESTYGGGKTSKGEAEIVPFFGKLLRDLNIRGTFNFVGKVAEEFPDVVREICSWGHDIAGHGYSHTFLDGLTYDEQVKEIEQTISTIFDITGRRIVGFRTPFLTYNKATYEIMEKSGIEWSSTWSRSLWGKIPFRPIIEGTLFDIIEIPVDDIHFDAAVYRWDSPPKEVNILWKNHLFVTRKERGLFVFLNHPVHMAPSQDRVDAVEDLILYAKKLTDLWLVSCEDISNRWRKMENIQIQNMKVVKNKDKYDITIDLINTGDRDISDVSILITGISDKCRITGIENKLMRFEKDDLAQVYSVSIHIPHIKAESARTLDISIRD